MRRCFGARPSEFYVLAEDELELAAIASLDRGKIDLALTLGGMCVADRKQRATVYTGMNSVVPATKSLLSMLPV